MKKKKIKKERLFWSAVIAACIVGVICVGSALFDMIGGIVDNYTPSMSDELSEVTGILTTVKDELGAAAGNVTTDFGLSDIASDTSSTDNTSAPTTSSTASTSTPTVSDSQRIKATVTRVVDGDTYVLNIDGTDTKVRLIGVDTPESVAPAGYHKENTEEGVKVSEIVKNNIKSGETLYVEYDIGRTDKYGRTLAYLYFENGTMVQDWLLSNGYAQVMTIQPNSKYASHFAEVEHQAMENKIGLWRD